MCDTRALSDEICDYISAPFGLGLNEHVRKSVALKIAEALKPSHNTGSPKLPPCEQLYLGCAIDGASGAAMVNIIDINKQKLMDDLIVENLTQAKKIAALELVVKNLTASNSAVVQCLQHAHDTYTCPVNSGLVHCKIKPCKLALHQ